MKWKLIHLPSVYLLTYSLISLHNAFMSHLKLAPGSGLVHYFPTLLLDIESLLGQKRLTLTSCPVVPLEKQIWFLKSQDSFYIIYGI